MSRGALKLLAILLMAGNHIAGVLKPKYRFLSSAFDPWLYHGTPYVCVPLRRVSLHPRPESLRHPAPYLRPGVRTALLPGLRADGEHGLDPASLLPLPGVLGTEEGVGLYPIDPADWLDGLVFPGPGFHPDGLWSEGG